ncbi:MAG: penicillin-binding protein 2 [Ignavibacteriaceae bacterium]|nr:penicillin-binding protein 2 [Ignavibacteriaceae bacterium]
MKSDFFGSLKRRAIFYFIITISVTVLGFRLFQMQIVNQKEYETKSSDNSVKSIELDPLRGLFYDRNMNLLVSISPAFTLRVTPAYYDTSLNKLIETVIGAEFGFINIFLKQNRIYSKYLPLRLKRGIDFKVVAWIEENRENLPGIDYVLELYRNYPAGINASHSFGYTKEISAEQLAKNKEHYKQGDFVGYNGIEKTYEDKLRGKKGYEYILVDSRRRDLGSFNFGSKDLPPVNGRSIVLTIDAETQIVAEEELKDKRGAIVAIDPSNGEILAMVSAPDYDLNKFSFITPNEFISSLYNDPARPLFNRATMTINPPGSTFKMLAAIAALALGIITPSYTIQCKGGFTYGRFFKCHGSHGTVNVIRAIEKSCNTFFYRLIYKIGMDRWKEYALKFGFAQKTNIDIPEETAGFIPDESYYINRYGDNWPKSIMASLGIGQGEVSVTPLQLAQYTALIANNGSSVQPHLVRGIFDESQNNVDPLNFDPVSTGVDKSIIEIVKEGMYLVVNGKGTATHIRLPDIEVAGKTGTAQNPHGEDHAWFVAFAPFENPKIALAVLVENVGFGGTHAAPIAKKIIETYLRGLDKNKENKLESENKFAVKD